MIGNGAVIRAGAVIYAGTEIGQNTVIGHHTLLRSFVSVGSETQLGHNLTIERATRIGRLVRCSPGSHVTSSCVLADRVFLGAGVRTVNDKEMTWRDPDGREPNLAPPVFSTGFGRRVAGRAGPGWTELGGRGGLGGRGRLSRRVGRGRLGGPSGKRARAAGRALGQAGAAS